VDFSRIQGRNLLGPNVDGPSHHLCVSQGPSVANRTLERHLEFCPCLRDPEYDKGTREDRAHESSLRDKPRILNRFLEAVDKNHLLISVKEHLSPLSSAASFLQAYRARYATALCLRFY
jgi:hypothetical protein